MEPHIIPPGSPEKKQKLAGSMSCLGGIACIILFIAFVFFGTKIFSFFHILNFYYFIISFIVTLIIYIVAMILTAFFTTYPKDLLGMEVRRYEKD